MTWHKNEEVVINSRTSSQTSQLTD